jgi:hypothetical protein
VIEALSPLVGSYLASKDAQLERMARDVYRPGARMLFALLLAVILLAGVALLTGHADLAHDVFALTLTAGLALAAGLKHRSEE